MVELSDLYSQVRSDFQQVVGDAHNALEERDQYIAHLVDRVQQWETQFFAPQGQTLEEQTGEFRALPNPGRIGELEAELARMQDEQSRLKAELDEKQKLQSALDAQDIELEEAEEAASPATSEEE